MKFDTFRWYVRNLSYLELALRDEDGDKDKLHEIQDSLFKLIDKAEKQYTAVKV